MLASPTASFLSVDAGIGLTPDCGVSFLLPQMIGPAPGRGNVAKWQGGARQLGARLASGATPILGPTKRLLVNSRQTA
ncbi:hypothetical protein [Arthrobacter sp. A5]|uniref:hypothetical protein n=1 Tax=Arthrobacter sp. A5 TaxID=576926 RepID=UPI003DA7FADD